MHSKKWGINKLKEERKRLAGELLIADGKLEAVKKYCLGVLEETKDFPNWMVIVRKLMRDILKILEAP